MGSIQQICLRFEAIRKSLSPYLKAKIHEAVPLLNLRFQSPGDSSQLGRAALSIVQRSFPTSSVPEKEGLVFYLICLATAATGQRPLGEPQELDALRLQLATRKVSSFNTVLSNMMTRQSDMQKNIIQNMR